MARRYSFPSSPISLLSNSVLLAATRRVYGFLVTEFAIKMSKKSRIFLYVTFCNFRFRFNLSFSFRFSFDFPYQFRFRF